MTFDSGPLLPSGLVMRPSLSSHMIIVLSRSIPLHLSVVLVRTCTKRQSTSAQRESTWNRLTLNDRLEWQMVFGTHTVSHNERHMLIFHCPRYPQVLIRLLTQVIAPGAGSRSFFYFPLPHNLLEVVASLVIGQWLLGFFICSSLRPSNRSSLDLATTEAR